MPKKKNYKNTNALTCPFCKAEPLISNPVGEVLNVLCPNKCFQTSIPLDVWNSQHEREMVFVKYLTAD